MIPSERFGGGKRIIAGALALGALGWLGMILTLVFDTRRALFGYLFGYVFWLGLALAAFLLLAVFHVTATRWAVVMRRPIEHVAGTVGLLAILFLPILLGMRDLYSWADPAALAPELRRLAEHRRPWLNVPFFVVRAVVYFSVWTACSELLLRWSRRQDEGASLEMTRRQKTLSYGALPVFSLALSFATLDWLISLEQAFYSTIYALYFFTGAFVAVMALLAVVIVLSRRPPLIGSLVRPPHLSSLGKLILGFTVFWFYMAFCQYILMWIANLPGEVSWYLVRTTGPWLWVAYAVLVAQFVVPFFLLLSRRLKRNPVSLAAISVWILAAHVLDTWWLVLPALEREGPRVHIADLAALLAVGGPAVAFALWRARGQFMVPVSDPYLRESLEYRKA